jgi:hypothetical protein
MNYLVEEYDHSTEYIERLLKCNWEWYIFDEI